MGDPRVTAVSLQLVEKALTESAGPLQQLADQGQADAQFSYSIVKRYGLDGGQPDAGAADAYRKLALASHGTTTTTMYVPDGKHDSQAQQLSVPFYPISKDVAKTADECVDALAARVKAEAVTTQCGGPSDYRRLADLWSRRRS